MDDNCYAISILQYLIVQLYLYNKNYTWSMEQTAINISYRYQISMARLILLKTLIINMYRTRCYKYIILFLFFINDRTNKDSTITRESINLNYNPCNDKLENYDTKW